VTDIIAEIAAASGEQSAGIDQVNRAVAQMDRVVQSNAAQTEELSSTAQTLASQAQQLETLVGRFTLDDRRMDATPAAPDAMRLVPAASAPRRALSPASQLVSAGALATKGHNDRNAPGPRHDDDFEESTSGASTTTRSGRSL
jgi:methyl-accepting chemotaxis protein